MQAIRSQSRLENRFSKALWHKGVRFRKNVKSLKGKPDIAIKKYKVVIFIDSCFWHACPIHGTRPKSNTEYWDKKLERNKERDLEINRYYQDLGWNILRIWEHEIKEDMEKAVFKALCFIEESKNKYNNSGK